MTWVGESGARGRRAHATWRDRTVRGQGVDRILRQGARAPRCRTPSRCTTIDPPAPGAGHARIDPLIVIRWKDIYDALEAALDACETAANVLGNVVVKNQ